MLLSTSIPLVPNLSCCGTFLTPKIVTEHSGHKNLSRNTLRQKKLKENIKISQICFLTFFCGTLGTSCAACGRVVGDYSLGSILVTPNVIELQTFLKNYKPRTNNMTRKTTS